MSLAGLRVAVTAARRGAEQVALLERRGARVTWTPVLSTAEPRVDPEALRAATGRVLAAPVDVLLATTGIGLQIWFDSAAADGRLDPLLGHLAGAEILARGPKSVGILRRHGLREAWAPDSECFDDVVARLLERDLTGVRVAVQEHGQDLTGTATLLRFHGARVRLVTIYRVPPTEDRAAVQRLVAAVSARELDAVTFTSAPAVAELFAAAEDPAGLRDAFADGVVAASVGPVTSGELRSRGVDPVEPGRARLRAMVQALEVEMGRRTPRTIRLADGELVLRGGDVTVAGRVVNLPAAPGAVLGMLASRPGHVVSRAELRTVLPAGGSDHAVEVAVARLRAELGGGAVETVVKRGYRLATG